MTNIDMVGSGNISLGDLATFFSTATGIGANGGTVRLNSSNGNITTGAIDTYSQVFSAASNTNAGNGGAISLNSAGNISTASLNSYSIVGGSGTSRNGGAINFNKFRSCFGSNIFEVI